MLVALELKISQPCKPELHHRRRRGNAGGLDGLWPAQRGRKAVLPVLNLPPSAALATAIAGVSCTQWEILSKIIAGALQKTALFLTDLKTRKRRIKKQSSVWAKWRRKITIQGGTWTSISAEGISTAGIMSWVSRCFASPISGLPRLGHLQ